MARGLGLSPISRDVIGLASHFGSIIVKCRLSTWALRALKLRDLNPVDTSWSAFNYYIYIAQRMGAAEAIQLNAKLSKASLSSTSTLHIPYSLAYIVPLSSISPSKQRKIQRYANKTVSTTCMTPLENGRIITCPAFQLSMQLTSRFKSDTLY